MEYDLFINSIKLKSFYILAAIVDVRNIEKNSHRTSVGESNQTTNKLVNIMRLWNNKYSEKNEVLSLISVTR